MKPFVSSEICAQNLLTLVSHGNAIIAEMLKIKDHIPSIFILSTKEEQLRYNDIIMDFSYFKSCDQIEEKLCAEEFKKHDQEIKEKHLDLITRFYLAFEGIYQYAVELSCIVEQLLADNSMHNPLDTIIQDEEGKQLLCESLYLFGAILLICDLYIPGIVRERLIVAFYRYNTNQSLTQIANVCKLLADTGFTHEKIPVTYPVDFFSRFSMKQAFCEAVINVLRKEDIYSQLKVYALTEYRSVALATQASMLFVVLFFSPHILKEGDDVMKEITQKFFEENWVVPVYMGIVYNVFDFWDGYKSAKHALVYTANAKNLKSICAKYKNKVESLSQNVEELLQEGFLTDDIILDDMNRIISLIREANIVIRWLMLHTSNSMSCRNKKAKQVRDTVVKEAHFNKEHLLNLLIVTAQLELFVRKRLQHHLNEKNNNWKNHIQNAANELESLSVIFSEGQKINKIKANEELSKWFENISKDLLAEDNEISRKSSKKISLLIKHLERVEDYHNIKSSLLVVQSLSEAKLSLKYALRTASLKEDAIVSLQVIADFSYARIVIENYTELIQDMIKQDPSVLGRLRSLFMKLATAMEIPLIRINQSESEDLESVSQYYSSELVLYIQKVVQIIPEMVFEILSQIIEILTWQMKEVPTRLDKSKIKEFSQLEERLEVAKLTHSASTFMKGILEMKTTFVGVIKVDPSKLLEDGIKEALSKNIKQILDQCFEIKNKKGPPLGFSCRLQILADRMNGSKSSLEYIQDYINCNGLRLWNEELSKIIQNDVKLALSELKHGSHVKKNSFMGCLANEILQHTSPRLSYYSLTKLCWIDHKTSESKLDLKSFSSLKDVLGPSGLSGLDKMFASSINENVLRQLEIIKLIKLPAHNIESDDKPFSEIVHNFCTKNSRVLSQICDEVISTGVMQILRKHIAFKINSCCKYDNGRMESALKSLNDALLLDIENDFRKDVSPTIPIECLRETEDYLTGAGLYDPFEKIYLEDTDGFETKIYEVDLLCLAVFVSQLNRLHVSPIGDVIPKKLCDNIDGHSFIVGLHTLLKQFYQVEDFLDVVAKYYNSLCNVSLSNHSVIPHDSDLILHMLEDFSHTFQIPFSIVESGIQYSLMAMYSNKEEVNV